jgi:serine/threonine-protein kinase
MTPSSGDKLGPYEVIGRIGAGGMGEVYRARDTRLGRDVAVKVSAERFTERFEREARAVAALNHSNICTLYDVGPNYLVMEYVEGESPKGPMPVDEALRLARQIADALAEAHEKGVVHRDLKPGNIKVTPGGTVKVLDFGLAKVSPVSPVDIENSPTISMAATEAGIILGTAGYMSPEQARGKPVDKRADIWAFGVVMYEMLTGERLFAGEDVSETLAAIIREEPNLDRVPQKVRRLLKSCLEKDPKKRLRDIGDAWRLLDEPVAVQVRPSPRWPWVVSAASVLLAGLLLWAPWRREAPSNRPLVRLDVDLGSDVALTPPDIGGTSVIISPDGTRIAYVASINGAPAQLFTRRLDQMKATELPGTQGASAPFFSPDGQWIGFFTGYKLNKVSVEGGAVAPILDTVGAEAASWGGDDYIYTGFLVSGVMRIPSGGGPAIKVTDLEAGKDFVHAFPQLLPGGKAVLFTSYGLQPSPANASVEVFSLSDHRRKLLVRGGVGGL